MRTTYSTNNAQHKTQYWQQLGLKIEEECEQSFRGGGRRRWKRLVKNTGITIGIVKWEENSRWEGSCENNIYIIL